jgi:hypothetical protein
MTVTRKCEIVFVLAFLAVPLAGAAGGDELRLPSVSGKGNSCPPDYTPPLISNGSLCMLIDYLGGQTPRRYANTTPEIFWAGRRHGRSLGGFAYQLISFGHFVQKLSCKGQTCDAPSDWTQTLNTREAVTTCRHNYGGSLAVETTVFVPLSYDVVVVNTKCRPMNNNARTARIEFKYRLPSASRMVVSPEHVKQDETIELPYQVDGYRRLDGVVLILADKPVQPRVDRPTFTLTADLTLDHSQPAEVTFFLVPADSLDGHDFRERAARLKGMIREQ